MYTSNSTRSARFVVTLVAALALSSTPGCRSNNMVASAGTGTSGDPRPASDRGVRDDDGRPRLRLELITGYAEVGSGISSYTRGPNGEMIPGPIGPGLLTATVDRLVYDGGARIDLPRGSSTRIVLLMTPNPGYSPLDSTWASAIPIDDRPGWVHGDEAIYAVAPRSDSSFANVRLDGSSALEPTAANPMGLIFTTPASGTSLGLAIIDADDHIIDSVGNPNYLGRLSPAGAPVLSHDV